MFQEKTALSSVDQLGEFGLIKHLTKSIQINQPETILGIGDDAAILSQDSENQTVISSDLLVEGIHFNLAYVPLKHLGYKAVVVNISDICAMNATPKQVMISLAVSNRFTVEALEELYAGIQLAAKQYNIDIIGGDTTSSPQGMTLSITAIGIVEKSKAITRKGANVNDLIVVTGDLGAAYLGLQILERENEVFKVNPHTQPDLSEYTYLLERQLKPEARTDIKEKIKQLAIHPTAMIDISDGLASELLHICTQSEVGCTIYEEKLPIDPSALTTAEELNMNSTTIAINGGEDYELLFTMPLAELDLIKNHPDFTIIGHITDKTQGYNMNLYSNQLVPLTAKGWDAFLQTNQRPE